MLCVVVIIVYGSDVIGLDTFQEEKFLLVFTSGDETCSSMVIQVHQDIGDTGYIQIQVTQSKYIITRQKHGIVKAECYVG